MQILHHPTPTPAKTNTSLYNTHLHTSHAKFNVQEVLKCVDCLAMKILHNPSTHSKLGPTTVHTTFRCLYNILP